MGWNHQPDNLHIYIYIRVPYIYTKKWYFQSNPWKSKTELDEVCSILLVENWAVKTGPLDKYFEHNWIWINCVYIRILFPYPSHTDYCTFWFGILNCIKAWFGPKLSLTTRLNTDPESDDDVTCWPRWMKVLVCDDFLVEHVSTFFWGGEPQKWFKNGIRWWEAPVIHRLFWSFFFFPLKWSLKTAHF